MLIFLLPERVSCSPGCLGTGSPAEDGPDILVFLPLSPSAQTAVRNQHAWFMECPGRAHGFKHVSNALYQLCLVPNPRPSISRGLEISPGVRLLPGLPLLALRGVLHSSWFSASCNKLFSIMSMSHSQLWYTIAKESSQNINLLLHGLLNVHCLKAKKLCLSPQPV